MYRFSEYYQKGWEIKRLRKDIDHLRKEQIQSAQLAAAEAAANVRHRKNRCRYLSARIKILLRYNPRTTLY